MLLFKKWELIELRVSSKEFKLGDEIFMNKKFNRNTSFLNEDEIKKNIYNYLNGAIWKIKIINILLHDFLNFNLKNPYWINRDRFVLSKERDFILLINKLFQSEKYENLERKLKSFCFLYSKTKDSIKYDYSKNKKQKLPIFEGNIANAVGMAIAEKILAAQFNRPGYDIINHFTYVFLGESCTIDGISHEACSLAGTLNLGKLIAFYEKNIITNPNKNPVLGYFSENTAERFKAYNWHVINNIDIHDTESIKYAIKRARLITGKPSLLIYKNITNVGFRKKTTESKNRKIIQSYEKFNFECSSFRKIFKIHKILDNRERGQLKEDIWNKKFFDYKKFFPKEAKEFIRRMKGEIPLNFNLKTRDLVKKFQDNPSKIASRRASQNIIEIFSPLLPELLGGSADLSYSNLTLCSHSIPINKNFSGNYIHYGVREFGMIDIANGISLHGGFLPYISTFLIFVEYAYKAIRTAALSKRHMIMVYTHDSIGLGEDGPTHQPVEQLASLRVIPNLSTWRPCDQVESAVAWKYAVDRKDGPTALIFSRQELKQQTRTEEQLMNINRGGYILRDCKGKPELIFIATGSEVELTVAAWEQLFSEGIMVRVVSMPSSDVFDKQNISYREFVLPSSTFLRIAVEASIKDYWYKYVGLKGAVIGMNTFGESAPAKVLFTKFNFTVKNIVNKAKELLQKPFR